MNTQYTRFGIGYTGFGSGAGSNRGGNSNNRRGIRRNGGTANANIAWDEILDPDFEIGTYPTASLVTSAPSIPAANYPSYSTYESRLQTFRDDLHPCEGFAMAGFFLMDGTYDLYCYFCGSFIEYWKCGPDIWDDHERFLGKCYFHESFRTSDLNAPGVRLAIEMGFKMSMVKDLLQRTGYQYKTSDSFINACIERQNAEQLSSRTDGTAAVATSNPPKSVYEATIENKIRKEILGCKICMENDIDVVFVPCGHQMACFKCASTFKTCPVCRKDISTTIRTYFS